MIICIEGNLGDGKSATMARMALHYSSMCSVCNGIIRARESYVIPILMREGFDPHYCNCDVSKPYRIHSNFWISDIQDFHYVTCVEDIDKIHSGFAFLDEFWSWIDSRVSGYSDINLVVTGILLNSRKRGFHVIYESKLIHMVDRRIRELTDYVLRPKKYVDIEGELTRIEQNMLYPINMLPYLDDSWVIVDEIMGEGLTQLNEGLFQYKLADIAHMYDTREEIKSLKDGEKKPGLEKGMAMETNFSKAIMSIAPDCKILRGGMSRGWDVNADLNGKKMSFDNVSVRSPRKGSKSPTIDLRGKRIKELLKSASKSNSSPYFSYNFDGKWWALPMLESHTVRTELSCRGAQELSEVLK